MATLPANYLVATRIFEGRKEYKELSMFNISRPSIFHFPRLTFHIGSPKPYLIRKIASFAIMMTVFIKEQERLGDRFEWGWRVGNTADEEVVTSFQYLQDTGEAEAWTEQGRALLEGILDRLIQVIFIEVDEDDSIEYRQSQLGIKTRQYWEMRRAMR